MHRLLIFLTVLGGVLHGQANKPPVFCQNVSDGGTLLEQSVGDYKLTLSPSKDQDAPCMAALRGPGKMPIWEKRLWQADFATPPMDISNDGKPDFVIEDYSGGAHCCWTYWIISPESRPVRALVLNNQMPLSFETKWRGKMTITTGDGAFDYFVTSHAFSVMPDVHLLLDGRTFFDISGEPEFRSEYDRDIARAKQELAKSGPPEKWLSQPVNEIDEEIRFNIMVVVLSYLYSRRPADAWQVLNELWPADDREQMKANILKTRRNGILKHALPFRSKLLATRTQ
jgi:hypothetical protein